MTEYSPTRFLKTNKKRLDSNEDPVLIFVLFFFLGSFVSGGSANAEREAEEGDEYPYAVHYCDQLSRR